MGSTLSRSFNTKKRMAARWALGVRSIALFLHKFLNYDQKKIYLKTRTSLAASILISFCSAIITDSVTSLDVCLDTSSVSTSSTLSNSEPFVSFKSLKN